jgi:hypothetical protein
MTRSLQTGRTRTPKKMGKQKPPKGKTLQQVRDSKR